MFFLVILYRFNEIFTDGKFIWARFVCFSLMFVFGGSAVCYINDLIRFLYPRKQVVIPGDQALSLIEIMLWVIASGPHWHPKEILQIYQQCQICCFDHVYVLLVCHNL